MRTLAKSMARRLGYDPDAFPEKKAARQARDPHLYNKWSSPTPVLTPWVEGSELDRLFREIEPHTIVTRDRVYYLKSFAEQASRLPGDFAECGVFTGGTALLLSKVLAGSGKALYLFDSFEGLPSSVDSEKDRWFEEGQFATDGVEKVRALLSGYEHTDIRQGWIPETFAGLEDRRFAFAHLDVDIYQSTIDCCSFFYPRLAAGGILVFDEYGFPAAGGERTAVDEFFADKLESPVVLPTGQAFVIKLPEA